MLPVAVRIGEGFVRLASKLTDPSQMREQVLDRRILAPGSGGGPILQRTGIGHRCFVGLPGRLRKVCQDFHALRQADEVATTWVDRERCPGNSIGEDLTPLRRHQGVGIALEYPNRHGYLFWVKAPWGTHGEVLVDTSSWLAGSFSKDVGEPLALLPHRGRLRLWQPSGGQTDEQVRSNR